MVGNGALRASVVLVAVVMLGACAGTQHKSAKIAPASHPVAQRGDAKGYRFNMTQHGKKMSAEDFDAWMKANGLHVAQGKAKPAAKGVTKSVGKAKPETKPKAKPEKVVAATAAKKPSRD